MYNKFLRRSTLFLKRIERRDLIRQRSILIRQINNRIRSSGVMRHGYNLEDIYRFRLYTKLVRKKSTTRIVYNTTIKERLDRCFRS
jgi:hypothetical protein